jgi:hypothetical protein
MSTPGSNLTTAVTQATEVVGSAEQITGKLGTEQRVTFNTSPPKVKEFRTTNSSSAISNPVSSPPSSANTENEDEDVDDNINDNIDNNDNDDNNDDNNNNSIISNGSNQSNENTEEPEIKSITIYNKTFLVETKVEDPLTEEQERLALHLRLPEFEDKDDKWRHSVLKEVIQGCTGDFSVTVGAQCHSFRSYLEELAQKVFDEDMPILWEGEEETKEDEKPIVKKKVQEQEEMEIMISIDLKELRRLLNL